MAALPAIEVRGLVKRYGDVVACDGLDLDVAAGTILGLLGPNGAGKTTLVRILATLLAPTGGRAAVLGRDVVAESLAVRRRIGLAGQFAAVDDELTGRENLEMIGRLCRLTADEARRRAEELLERLELTGAAGRRAATYSGGMRRRLDLAAGLIGRPPVVLLDEPTTGLDPRSRQELWRIVDELRREGTTILLTTQYLEEADRLAQRIAVLDHGRVVAQGTGRQLKAEIGGSVLRVQPAQAEDVARARTALADLATGDTGPDADTGHDADTEIRLTVSDPGASVRAVRRLDEMGVPLVAIQLEQPSLDDVFLALTGHAAHAAPVAAETGVQAR